jgi:VanZ family protein
MIDRGLWALTAACIATTVWFSFGAQPPGAHLFSGADKVGHAVAYLATTLSFLFAAVWRPGRGIGRFARLGGWFALAAIAGGAVIEILQSQIATRGGDLADLVAEVVGTAAAMAIHSHVRRRSTGRPAPAELSGHR